MNSQQPPSPHHKQTPQASQQPASQQPTQHGYRIQQQQQHGSAPHPGTLQQQRLQQHLMQQQQQQQRQLQQGYNTNGNASFSGSVPAMHRPPGWQVPNPLGSAGAKPAPTNTSSSPAFAAAHHQQQQIQQRAIQQQRAVQQQQQQQKRAVQLQQQQHTASSPYPRPPPPQQQPQAYPHGTQRAIPQRPAAAMMPAGMKVVPNGQKTKVILSDAAKQALAGAIYSAIKSPTGAVDPKLLQAAVAQGLPEHAIQNAARVARQRDQAKRDEQERQKRAEAQAKLEQNQKEAAERKKRAAAEAWKRLQHGVFIPQIAPYTQGALSKTTDMTPAVSLQKTSRPHVSSIAVASLQHIVRFEVDAERYKRTRLEPKKLSRGLERAARKTRQNAADALNKTYKDFTKAISSHQTDFMKFHRQRKSDAVRLSKAVRDSFLKQEKKKEKEEISAEKARLAALKANDMQAYSKLLEETRNDRLKFLLEKTEKHFDQISSLLQERSGTAASSSEHSSSYYATAHKHSEEVRQPGILVGGELKEYQLAGLQWMVSLYNNRLNGILADEMGLGKTIQAISLLAYLMEFKQNLGPFLVIVPLSTLSNWSGEFTKWCPTARTICYKGTPTQRKEIYRDQVQAGHFNVLLTTYEYIIRDKKYLRKHTWQYAIVDEGHRMKNSASKFAVTLGTQYTTKYRILLTGTPLMNDLSELWALLNFLLPTIFNSVSTFDEWFSAPFAQFSGSNANEDPDENLLSNEERILIIHRLHELLRPFMLRRVKSEVLDQLPEKVEKVLRCELSSWQKELYKQISKKAVAENGLMGPDANVPARGLNNIVMQLRKVCNHPYLFSTAGYHMNEQIISSSAKLVLLDKMLPKLKAAGHRVLMFTQMTAVMTILEDYFAFRGYLSLRLDGSTPSEEREKHLTSADTVIIFDSDWNPAMDLQAQDRAHRIGQRSDVSVFRLITNSPVEEKILSRATEKMSVSQLVVESGKFNKDSVEGDNIQERKRLMEVLLTDFETSVQKSAPEKASSDQGDDEDDDEGSASSEKEDLNELLSNNDADFDLYTAFDREMEAKGQSPVELFSSQSDIPDWILHPLKAGSQSVFTAAGEGSRKRKDIMYDDGLTEKQFLKIMDKQSIAEENAKKKQKTAKGANRTDLSLTDGTSDRSASMGSTLTDWTYRKLISCSKTVVALKDPATKRRLSDVFIEKPDPATFPDYYEIVERPIAINDILRKCRNKLYASIPEFKEDWKLMFANAKKFNGEDSWVVQDATALDKELERVLKKNGFIDDQKPPTCKEKKKLRINISLKKK